MATQFQVEVPSGLRSLAGAKLAGGVKWSFRTGTARVLRVLPDQFGGEPRSQWRRVSGLGPLPILFLEFDQPIPDEITAQRVSFRDGSHEYPVRLATRGEVDADQEVPHYIRSSMDKRWVAIRPLSPLPRDRILRLIVGPGVRSLEGPRLSRREQSFSVPTCKPIRFGPAEGFNGYVDIDCNNYLDKKSVDASTLSVTPRVPNLRWEAGALGLSLSGDFDPRVLYTIRLRRGIRDTYGQKLVTTATFRLRVPPRSLSMPWLGMTRMAVVDPARATLPIYTSNVTSVTIELRQVEPEDWYAFTKCQPSFGRSERIGRLPGLVAYRKELAWPRQGRKHDIDLRPALSDGAGHVLVRVTGPGLSEQLAWVQVTRLTLWAANTGHQLIGWVTDRPAGRNVKGAYVEVRWDSSRQGAFSGPNGLARVPGSVPSRAMVVASLGSDSVFLPIVDSPWTAQHRWHVLKDKGRYQPGDKVRLNGWVRGPVSDHVRYSLRDCHDRVRSTGLCPVRPWECAPFELDLQLPADMPVGKARLGLSASLSADSSRDTFSVDLPVGEYAERNDGLFHEIPGAFARAGVSLLGAMDGPSLDLRLQSPFLASEGLLLLQNSEIFEVLPVQWKGRQTSVRCALSALRGPSLQAALYLVGPEDTRGVATYAEGYARLPINIPDAQVTVGTPREGSLLAPDGALSLSLSYSRGQPCPGEAVVVISEGGTAGTLPDPRVALFPDSQCAVAHLWRNILVPRPPEEPRPRELAAPSPKASPLAPRATFQERVRFNTLGKAVVPLGPAARPGRYRIQVLGYDNRGRFGQAETTVTSCRSLDLELLCPEVLTAGDRCQLRVAVYNGENQDRRIELHLAALQSSVEAPVDLSLVVPGRSSLELPFWGVMQGPGSAQVTVSATASNGERTEGRSVVEVRSTKVEDLAQTTGAEENLNEEAQPSDLSLQLTSRALQIPEPVSPDDSRYGKSGLVLNLIALRELGALWEGYVWPEQRLTSEMASLLAEQTERSISNWKGIPANWYHEASRDVLAGYALARAREAGLDVPKQSLDSTLRRLRDLPPDPRIQASSLWVRQLLGESVKEEAQALLTILLANQQQTSTLAWLAALLPEEREPWELLMARLSEDAVAAHFHDLRGSEITSCDRDGHAAALLAMLKRTPGSPLVAKLATGLVEDSYLSSPVTLDALAAYHRAQAGLHQYRLRLRRWVEPSQPVHRGLSIVRTYEDLEGKAWPRDPDGAWLIPMGAKVRVHLEVSPDALGHRPVCLKDCLPGGLAPLRSDLPYPPDSEYRVWGLEAHLPRKGPAGHPPLPLGGVTYYAVASWRGRFLVRPTVAWDEADPGRRFATSGVDVVRVE